MRSIKYIAITADMQNDKQTLKFRNAWTTSKKWLVGKKFGASFYQEQLATQATSLGIR